jgi:hypothetical protein
LGWYIINGETLALASKLTPTVKRFL